MIKENREALWRILEIRSNYDLIKNKKAFVIALAKHLNKQPTSIQNNWFSRFWAIPEQHQSEVLEFLINHLKTEK